MPSGHSGGAVINSGQGAGSSLAELHIHPDYRQIAAFFLGWAFLYSARCTITSHVFSNLGHRCSRFFRGLVRSKRRRGVGGIICSLEKPSQQNLQLAADDTSSSILLPDAHRLLVLLLSICIAFGSLAQFSALLTFGSNGGSSACAFVIAWSGISFACARLVGLIVISMEMRSLGASKWEAWLLWGSSWVGMIFVFTLYSISTGSLQFISQLGVNICYRARNFPIALTTSVLYMCIELVVILRVFTLIAPSFLEFGHRIQAIQDIRFARALALLVFDLLVVVPMTSYVGVVGEDVPLSLGSLVVLLAFNGSQPAIVTGEEISMSSLSLSGGATPTITLKASKVDLDSYIPNHPFATRSYRSYRNASSHSSVSSPSTPSISTSEALENQSTRQAVIQVAKRSKRPTLPHLFSAPAASAYVPPLSVTGGMQELSFFTYDPPSVRSLMQPRPQAPPTVQHLLLQQDEYARQWQRDKTLARLVRPGPLYHGLLVSPATSMLFKSPVSATSVRFEPDVRKSDSSKRTLGSLVHRAHTTWRTSGSSHHGRRFRYQTTTETESAHSACASSEERYVGVIGPGAEPHGSLSHNSTVRSATSESSHPYAPSSYWRTRDVKPLARPDRRSSRRILLHRLPSLTHLERDSVIVEDQSPVDPGISLDIQLSPSHIGSRRLKGPRPRPTGHSPMGDSLGRESDFQSTSATLPISTTPASVSTLTKPNPEKG